MMYKEFFVFISEKHFGVFRVDASDYPEEFKRNPQNIHVVEGYQIENYLINSVGRNILIYHNFIFPQKIGKLFLKHPKGCKFTVKIYFYTAVNLKLIKRSVKELKI